MRVRAGANSATPSATLSPSLERMAMRFALADRVLISTPMWNFGIPYKLKQWFDLIVQPGLTFRFDPAQGYFPLLQEPADGRDPRERQRLRHRHESRTHRYGDALFARGAALHRRQRRSFRADWADGRAGGAGAAAREPRTVSWSRWRQASDRRALRCYFFNMASRCLTSFSSSSCCRAMRSEVRSSSCAPKDAAACSTNCRILSRSTAMRSSSSGNEGELSLLMFVPGIVRALARLSRMGVSA